MKKRILSTAFASFACLLAAQPIGDQPKVRFHESQFSQHSYFTVGDSIVTERELALYFKMADSEAYETFNFGLKLDRSRRLARGIGIAGAAIGLVFKNRNLDRIGYGGMVLSSLLNLGLGIWSSRKKGTGLHLYNSKRSRRGPRLRSPVAQPIERMKPYSVINLGGN